MWNTCYAKELNSVVHLPDALRVRIALYDEEQKFLLNHMLWRNQEDSSPEYRNISQFGMHSSSGDYFDISFQYKEFRFQTIFASENNEFVYRIIPKTKGNMKIDFVITASILWNRNGKIEKKENGFVIETENDRYAIQIYGSRQYDYPINTDLQGIFMGAEETWIVCNKAEGEEEWKSFLEQKRGEVQKKLPVYKGRMENLAEAIQRANLWNWIYDPVKQRFCAPVSRAWCTRNGKSFGSYVLFEWDTFFSALMFATFDKEMAYAQVKAIFQEMTSDGMLPNFGSERGGSPDRSQPPVGAYCLLKLYYQFQDIELLETYYDALCKWNRWWHENRDGNKDGFLEWGSNPNPDGQKRGYFDNGNTMQCAMYESGLDNSPMYDGISFNEETHTMELADVGLNALYALDCLSLARISGILGKEKEEKDFQKKYSYMKKKMNEEMYDEETGMYCNLHWNGKKDKRFSPTNFYPMLAEIPSTEQTDRIINEHLRNEKEFWGEYVIPSISKREKSYEDQDYWRGRIWGPMNFLVYEGIRQYDYEKTASEFAEKSRKLLLKEWLEENHIHENYNGKNGDGDDKLNADPMYTWGALLAYIPVCQGIYISPKGEVLFGCAVEEDIYIEKFPIGEDLYTLDTRKKFQLWKNDTLIMENRNRKYSVSFKITKGELVLRKGAE